MLRQANWLALACLATPLAWAQTGVLRLDVDATDAPRRLIHAKLNVPLSVVTRGVSPYGSRTVTLLYPKWIPGEHEPSGPIADVVRLRVSAHGESIPWRRDAKNLYAFTVSVPPSASSVDVEFDFISAADAGGFSSGSSMTTELAVLSWNQFVLYPQGRAADQIRVQANLRIPTGWQYGTALPAAKEADGRIEFKPVALTELIDSPVSAGAHYRTIDLGAADGAHHFLHIAADSEHAIVVTDEMIERYRKLIAEAGALFGSRHYRNYHFLLTLSDHVASFGLEHHESSDDRVAERTLIEENLRILDADLLAHEFVHSWNGKFRRPAGLITKNYNETIDSDLLWIYEGLTEYYGEVLSTRADLGTAQRFRDWLAKIAAEMDRPAGRSWRSLRDTSISAQLLYGAHDDYAALRRGVDFYSEGALLWLEADTLIRESSQGTKSLDDFCRVFYSGPGGAPVVKGYALADVIAALNDVQRYEWARFFADRVEKPTEHAPIAGIQNGGWTLSFQEKRPDLWAADEDDKKISDLSYSLGLVVKSDGTIKDVEFGGLAQRTGLAPGGVITQVNARQFSLSLIRDAIRNAADTGDPIEIVVKNGEYYATYHVSYRGGERYPRLERDGSKADLLTAIVKAKAK
ncbi:MAG: M61 family peptidase [Bryobacteraceae bacterium]